MEYALHTVPDMVSVQADLILYNLTLWLINAKCHLRPCHYMLLNPVFSTSYKIHKFLNVKPHTDPKLYKS